MIIALDYKEDKETVYYSISNIENHEDINNIVSVYQYALTNLGYGFELCVLFDELGVDYELIQEDLRYTINQNDERVKLKTTTLDEKLSQVIDYR